MYIYTLYLYIYINIMIHIIGGMIHIIGGMITIPKWVVYGIVLSTLLETTNQHLFYYKKVEFIRFGGHQESLVLNFGICLYICIPAIVIVCYS